MDELQTLLDVIGGLQGLVASVQPKTYLSGGVQYNENFEPDYQDWARGTFKQIGQARRDKLWEMQNSGKVNYMTGEGFNQAMNIRLLDENMLGGIRAWEDWANRVPSGDPNSAVTIPGGFMGALGPAPRNTWDAHDLMGVLQREPYLRNYVDPQMVAWAERESGGVGRNLYTSLPTFDAGGLDRGGGQATLGTWLGPDPTPSPQWTIPDWWLNGDPNRPSAFSRPYGGGGGGGMLRGGITHYDWGSGPPAQRTHQPPSGTPAPNSQPGPQNSLPPPKPYYPGGYGLAQQPPPNWQGEFAMGPQIDNIQAYMPYNDPFHPDYLNEGMILRTDGFGPLFPENDRGETVYYGEPGFHF